MSDGGFCVPQDVLDALCSSEPFQILSKHLFNDAANVSCEHHDPPSASTLALACSLHLLLQPISRLHQTCSRLADAVLCSPAPSELELAFRNEARSAFLWLSCFLDDAEADDWMATKGCPGCVVDHTLSCDSTVRMALAACLVAQTRRANALASSDSHQYADVNNSTPDFTWFLAVFKTALDSDSFWGPSYYPNLMPKAEGLCEGIQALVTQAAELEILVSSPSPSPLPSNKSNPTRLRLPTAASPKEPIHLRIGPLAKRQQKLQREEEAQLRSLQRLAWQVNGAVALDKTQRMMLKGVAVEERSRIRSMTWQG